MCFVSPRCEGTLSVIPPNSKKDIKSVKSLKRHLLDASCHTNLPQFQCAWPDRKILWSWWVYTHDMRHVLLQSENVHVFELGSITKHTARLHEAEPCYQLQDFYVSKNGFWEFAEKQNHQIVHLSYCNATAVVQEKNIVMPIWDSFHIATCNINFSVCWISLFTARFRPPYHPNPQAMMGQVCIFPLCSSKRFCYGKFGDHVLFLVLKKQSIFCHCGKLFLTSGFLHQSEFVHVWILIYVCVCVCVPALCTWV